MNRTPDLLITNELLYRLSYTGQAFNYSAVKTVIHCSEVGNVQVLR